MPARRSARERLQDMVLAMGRIETFLSGKGRDDFASDAMLHDVVVRNLEIISDASRNIPEGLKARESGIPWRSVADMGNWLRHGYDIVSDDILWETISRDLPVLKVVVQRLLSAAKER